MSFYDIVNEVVSNSTGFLVQGTGFTRRRTSLCDFMHDVPISVDVFHVSIDVVAGGVSVHLISGIN